MLDNEMETAFDRCRGFMRAVLAKAEIHKSQHGRSLIKRLLTRFIARENLNSLRRQIDLICHLAQRDFHLQYSGSVLGILWSMLLPLIQLLVFVFLFNRVVPLGIPDYSVFVFSTLLPWAWFSNCVGSAGSLFSGNRDLLRRPHFSPAILIVVNTLSNLLKYLMSLPILLGLLALHERAPTAAVLVFPLLLLIQSVLLIGLGLMIATANVFYRDIQQLAVVALSLLFYLIPIFYRPQQVDAHYTRLLTLNPIAVLIQSYREIFYYQRAPEWEALFFVSVFSLVMAALGYLVYYRQQARVIDYL